MLGIDDVISELIVENTEVEKSSLVRSATFSSLDLDSLDVVTLLYEIEEKYNVEIDLEDIEGVETYGDFIDKIQQIIKSSAQ